MPNPLNFLQYNGVTMDLIKMHTWHREAIYNGNQYLYTRNIIAVTCVLNPAVNPILQQLGFAVLPANQNNLAELNVNGGKGLQQPPAIQVVPVAVPNPQLAMVTDTLIKHALMQPRQQLTYSIHGYAPLFSPWIGYSTDASGGPLPLYCDPIEIQSSHTWIVRYVIQTDVNECAKYTKKPKILLSHTWNMAHSIDQDCFTTRTIQGRAVFAKDRLEPNAFANANIAKAAAPVLGNLANVALAGVPPLTLQADDWRSQLFHYLPTNFKREKVEVKLQPDGCTLDYVIIDRERALNINFPNVTRIEGIHQVDTAWAGAAGLYSAQRNFVTRAASNLFKGVLWNEASPASGDPIPGVNEIAEAAKKAANLLAVSTAGIAEAALFSGIEAIEALIPQIVHHINFKIWGNRNSTRAGLTQTALGLLASRLAPTANQINIGQLNPNVVAGNRFVLGVNDLQQMLNNAIPKNPINLTQILGVAETAIATLAGFKCSIIHDLAGKYVELNFSTIASPLSMFFLGPQTVNLLVGPDDTIVSGQGAETQGIVSNVWDTVQGYPTNDLSRGTYLEELVSQILLAPCQTPPAQNASVKPPVVTSELKPTVKLPLKVS